MIAHHPSADPIAPKSWATVRSLVLIGLGALLGASAVWLATHPLLEVSDRYYATGITISRASKLAVTCYYRQPATLAELAKSGLDDEVFRDFWGTTFRYARMPTATGEVEVYVWTERMGADGRATVIGAKVTTDGKTVLLGLPREN
jgi:hypothetical protein